jgi:formylglycine-generating enzyme required for sulfatase activity
MVESTAGRRLKVFVSYSRRDSAEFADELAVGLELAGFAPFLDRHDIAVGEDWEFRLDRLIQEADTVVCIISPEAVKSERCGWEVHRALAHSRRLLPVIFKPIPESDMPQPLRRLQFVRFDIGPGLARPLLQLAEALRYDADWIREHTRLAELAARWQVRDRPKSLLLRGDDLDAAKTLVVKRKSEAPEITDLQRAFLEASERSEAARIIQLKATRRQVRQKEALIGVLVLIIAVGVAWSNRGYLKARTLALAELLWPKALTREVEGNLKPGDRFKECANCPEMVTIPSGEFIMGSDENDDEKPAHKVIIAKSFAVSRFEVTFEEYDDCVILGGCQYHPSDQGWGRGSRPVINVNLDDAQQYVSWLSRRTRKPYRLMSEAEWEYAARAGTTSRYSFEADGWALGEYAWHSGNSEGRTHPVGQKEPNAFGLHDVLGNVWEWVQDCYQHSYSGAPTDGSARIESDCSRRVLRGGSWGADPPHLRSAARRSQAFDVRDSIIGFRIGRALAR